MGLGDRHSASGCATRTPEEAQTAARGGGEPESGEVGFRRTPTAVLVIPDDTPEFGGNWVSAQRAARALALRGHTASVTRTSLAPTTGAVLHAFNANTALRLLARGADPRRLVVTWTGTDIWTDLVREPERFGPLGAVAAQTVLEAGARRAILERFPSWADRVTVVPPGVDTRRFAPRGPAVVLERPALLLVGGGRPIKRALETVEWVEAVRDAGVAVSLVVLGPPRDPTYWADLEAAARSRPWFKPVVVVPFADMPRWYRGVDVVVNNSLVEGVSNALLEAMASACAVLAHDIPGNRALVRDGRTGVLFRNQAEFVAAAVRLCQDADARRALGRNARAWVRRRFDALKEADRFLALYARAAARP